MVPTRERTRKCLQRETESEWLVENACNTLEASEEDETSTDDVGRVDTILENMSPDQAYLSLFPISRSFDTLSVYEYSIEAAEAFEDAPDTVTYRCAGRLRRITGAGVAYAGSMRIVSTRKLPDKLADPFSLERAHRARVESD